MKYLSTTPASFADNAEISQEMLGHVNVAVDYSFLKGFSDGTFQPKSFITRAQMTVILSKAFKLTTAGNEQLVALQLIKIDNDKLILGEPDRSQTFKWNEQTVFFDSLSNKEVEPSDYLARQLVTLLIDGETVLMAEGVIQ